MSVQVVSNPNIIQSNIVLNRTVNSISQGSALRVQENHENAPTKLKIGVFLSTLTGVGIAMAMVFKGKGLSFKNPKDFIKNLRTITYKEDEMPGLVAKLAIGSVGGGLLGGILFDKKENIKAKLRESVIQIVGNIATPLGCVYGGNKLYEKFAEAKVMEKFKLGSKFKELPKIGVGAICLVAGIISGNKIGNFINKTAFNCDEKRTLKLTDMSPHIDDVATAATFAIPGQNPVGMFLQRIIPAALMISGYSVGTEREHSPKVKAKQDLVLKTEENAKV